MNIKRILFVCMILAFFMLISSVSASDDISASSVCESLISSQIDDVSLNEDNNYVTVLQNSNNSDISSINDNSIKSSSVNSQSSSDKIKISIKAPKTKIFKTKSKVKKYAVTLKANKKVVKKVNVYLTIKAKKFSKTFKATTNKNGKATFKILKLTKKGTYKATITFKGNANYYGVSKKLKITINKKKCQVKVASNDIVASEDTNFVDVSDAFKYLNAFRTEKGVWYWNSDDTTKTYFNTNNNNKLKALTWDSNLEKTAKIRAKEIAKLFSHTRPDGSSCFKVYPNNLLAMGENIASGQTSCFEVTEAWKETNYPYDGQGHRRNMLSSNFNCVGIAGYKLNGIIYWVHAFGLKK